MKLTEKILEEIIKDEIQNLNEGSDTFVNILNKFGFKKGARDWGGHQFFVHKSKDLYATYNPNGRSLVIEPKRGGKPVFDTDRSNFSIKALLNYLQSPKNKFVSTEGKLNERLKRFKVFVSGESEPLILMGKNEREVKELAYQMIQNSSVKVRKVVKEGKITENKQGYVVADIYGGVYTKKAVSEKKALSMLNKMSKWGGDNIFMIGVEAWNKPHKLNKKKKMVEEGKLKEDFGMSAKQLPSFSSKEAKKIIDDSVRQYASLLRKAEAKIIKDWMSKAKSGVLDYFDIVRGLETGDASRAYPFELRFLKGILDRDKIMNRFRSYFKGKKGKKRTK